MTYFDKSPEALVTELDSMIQFIYNKQIELCNAQIDNKREYWDAYAAIHGSHTTTAARDRDAEYDSRHTAEDCIQLQGQLDAAKTRANFLTNLINWKIV